MTCTVSSNVVIDLPRAAAWEKLRNLALAHHYVPGIVRTEIVGTRLEGPGASRRVYRSARRYLEETVVAWEDGRGFTIRLHKGDKPAFPFRAASFRYRLDDEAADRTRLTASLRYELPWGALGRRLEQMMEKPVARTVTDVALALKLYYETGEPTTAAALKAYRQDAAAGRVSPRR